MEKETKQVKDPKPIWIYLISSFLLPMILGFVCGLISVIINKDLDFVQIATIIVDIILFIIFIVLYGKKIVKDIRKLSFKDLIMITLMAGGIIVLNEIVSTIFEKLNVAMENQNMIINMFDKYTILSILAICVCAPVIEEIVFRYSLGTIIKKDRTFLIVSSLLFGIAHGIGIVTILYAGIGLLIGLIYLKYKKNLASSIIVHMLNNVFSIVVLFL